MLYIKMFFVILWANVGNFFYKYHFHLLTEEQEPTTEKDNDKTKNLFQFS